MKHLVTNASHKILLLIVVMAITERRAYDASMILWAVIPCKNDPLLSAEEYRKKQWQYFNSLKVGMV